MRRLFLGIIITMCMAWFGISTSAAQKNDAAARKILDRTAKVIGRSGGASASFTMNNASTGTVSGTIAIKGNKFNARTSQMTVWYNGKTQWTYMKKNNEVNVSTPTQAQQQMMNPYSFITMYKTGYKMSATTSGANDEVHLVAQNKNKSIAEMYITINRKTGVPSKVKMKHKGKWSTITVSNFSPKNLSNAIFTFNSKDYPTAEVIDLR